MKFCVSAAISAHLPMIRNALQLLVLGHLFAVGEPVKALPSVAVDPCYTHCEGVKVGIRSPVRYNAVSVQACRHVGSSVSATWEQSNTSLCGLLDSEDAVAKCENILTCFRLRGNTNY